jgi:hypothetical protein
LRLFHLEPPNFQIVGRLHMQPMPDQGVRLILPGQFPRSADMPTPLIRAVE